MKTKISPETLTTQYTANLMYSLKLAISCACGWDKWLMSAKFACHNFVSIR